MEKQVEDAINKLNTLGEESAELRKKLTHSLEVERLWPEAFKGGLSCKSYWYGVKPVNAHAKGEQYRNRGLKFVIERDDGVERRFEWSDVPSLLGGGRELAKTRKDTVGRLSTHM
jgi:hypothetical protein